MKNDVDRIDTRNEFLGRNGYDINLCVRGGLNRGD